MKYLIVSDLHVKRERLLEVDDIGTQVLSHLKLEKCKGIIIPGDVFDNENPTPDEINWFIGFLKKIPLTTVIYLIGGNHGKERSAGRFLSGSSNAFGPRHYLRSTDQ